MNRLITWFAWVIDKKPYIFLISHIILMALYIKLFMPDMIIIIIQKFLLIIVSTTFLVVSIKSLVKEKRTKKIKSIQDYRFPSFHQSLATSLCVYASIIIPILTPYFALLIFLTFVGRYIIGKHTWDELFVGSIIGLFIGFIIGIL